MKTIYTLTFCEWKSYGSILQTLGLQIFLRKMGYSPAVLQYRQIPGPEEKKRLRHPTQLNRTGHELFELLIMEKLKRRHQATEQFIRENIRVERYQDYDSLRQAPPEATVYLAGSDQIWNPKKLEPAFFLEFAPFGSRRITYAASMGTPVVPQEKKEQFCRYVQSFDRISLREKDNIPCVAPWAKNPVTRNIDPVFLPETREWRSYEKAYPGMEKPYILVYALYWDARLNRSLKQLHRETGLDVVAVAGGLQMVYANKRIYDADIAQFLWLIDHAQMVVSSSFHGVAMSAVFGKKCAAVLNPNSPSRIRNLMELLQMPEIPVAMLHCSSGPSAKTAEIIREERKRSEVYLKEALEE